MEFINYYPYRDRADDSERTLMMWLDGEDNSEETEDGKEWSDSSPESRFQTISQVQGPKTKSSEFDFINRSCRD